MSMYIDMQVDYWKRDEGREKFRRQARFIAWLHLGLANVPLEVNANRIARLGIASWCVRPNGSEWRSGEKGRDMRTWCVFLFQLTESDLGPRDLG
jgi:hypothetical protein